jgi:hypothetical protein
MTNDHPRSDPIVPMRNAATELGVHPSTLKRYAGAGLLRLWRVGPRKLGVRRSELERFLAANRPAHGPPESSGEPPPQVRPPSRAERQPDSGA